MMATIKELQIGVFICQKALLQAQQALREAQLDEQITKLQNETE
jgi:hypothetical protein